MSNFAILRIEKIKDFDSVKKAADHLLRAVDTPNSDPLRSISVLTGSSNSREVSTKIKSTVKPLIKRKDAIVCLDVLCAASPEFFESGGSIREFEAIAVQWAGEIFGKENIQLAVTHEDEKTPHVQMLITPIINGKLSASHWLDGPVKLAAMQTDFAEKMKHLGLVRGVEKSKAKHQKIKRWYGQLEPKIEAAEILLKEADEIQAKISAGKAENDALAAKLFEIKNVLSQRNKDLNLRQNDIDYTVKTLREVAAEQDEAKSVLSKIFGLLPSLIQDKVAALSKLFNAFKSAAATSENIEFLDSVKAKSIRESDDSKTKAKNVRSKRF